MSYNVLAPTLLENHSYLYRDANPGHLQWDNRKERFLKQVGNINPDILCLQEVEESVYETFYVKELSSAGIFERLLKQ